MLRKVASLLRERNSIDRRLQNITGTDASPTALADWLAQELLDLEPLPGGRGSRFTEGPLAGATVATLWVPAQSPSADRVATTYLLELHSDEADDSVGLAHCGHLTVERLVLVGRGGATWELYPEAEAAHLTLGTDQRDALALFSAETVLPLTRYH